MTVFACFERPALGQCECCGGDPAVHGRDWKHAYKERYGNPVLVAVAPTAELAERWRDEPAEGAKREVSPVNVIGASEGRDGLAGRLTRALVVARGYLGATATALPVSATDAVVRQVFDELRACDAVLVEARDQGLLDDAAATRLLGSLARPPASGTEGAAYNEQTRVTVTLEKSAART